MKKNFKGKVAGIIAVLLICVYGFLGIPKGLSGKAILQSISNRIHLGLDLQGGAHLILQVEVKEAVGVETDSTVGRLNQDLKTENIGVSQVYKPDPQKPEVIRIEGTTAEKNSDVRSLLDSKYSSEFDVTGGTDNNWTLTMKPSFEKAYDEKVVQQAIETIRDRVDSLGVAEPVIQQYGLGDNQILVELPGVSDMNEVKRLISETARLSIHAVVGGPYPDQQSALASVGGTLPPDDVIMSGSGAMAGGSGSADSFYVLTRTPIVGGVDFRSADPGNDANTGQRTVEFTLTNEAGDRFYQYTSANINHSMAVVLGGRVREVANIESAIRDRGEIRGSFSQQEVMDLSKMLRSGALPASLRYLEDRTVGASLGADSVRDGVTAAVVGVLVVMVFMLIYYKGAGINADLALFLNLVILLGFMGFSGSTLTLPGIAGVILTIGMGVDSNVLIFERIREEIRAGKAASAAVEQGFGHAWVTILDTHVTTIVSAAILFLFGTGPVKGFAVTLTFGLAANLFTAVYVSRLIFDAHLAKLKPGEMVSI